MPEAIRITVVYSDGPRCTRLATLDMQSGTTVAQAIRQSDLLNNLKDAEIDQLSLGVRGRKVQLNQLLRAGDRIDICRPLKVDPKMARRQRFARQGTKSAGLFASRRAGAKAGY